MNKNVLWWSEIENNLLNFYEYIYISRGIFLLNQYLSMTLPYSEQSFFMSWHTKGRGIFNIYIK